MATAIHEDSAPRAQGLIFVHVSDIHFHFRWSGGLLDRDADIAHQLILDAGRVCGSLGGCDGTLVNGDVVYSGRAAEYALAQRWLGDLSAGVGSDPLAVWVVPGNHDVDRPRPPAMRDTLIADLRNPSAAGRLNDTLRGHLAGDDGEAVLFKCLGGYNEFAGRYGCAVRAAQPMWQENFRLNDGSILRLHGLTSVIMSNQLDDDRANKVALGELQLTGLHEDPEVAHVTMCHHPFGWLLDASEVEPHLNVRARLQLFGHEHRQQLTQVDNSLRMLAGAVSPPRAESGWQPRYNVLQIATRTRAADRELVVDVHQRVWEPSKQAFLNAAGPLVSSYALKLPTWSPPPSKERIAAKIEQQPTNAPSRAAHRSEAQPPRITMSPERRLTYRFFQLPYTVRLDVVSQLGLNDDKDQGITDPELTRRFFERARLQRKLDRLWEQTRIRLGLPEEPNPFQANLQGGVTHA